ncbi:MAG: hypothetical protein M3Z24_16825, partial [Chloroflexota bacterium]|nr:hypothetical protein [Chloroflexota bacterium]
MKFATIGVRSGGIHDAPSAAGTRSHPIRPSRRFAARSVMNAATTVPSPGVMNAVATKSNLTQYS